MTRKTILWTRSVSARINTVQSRFLSRGSLRALSASSARTLLDAAASDVPDLIVLSDDLAEMSASDILRKLRSDERTRGIPIIVVAQADRDGGALSREEDIRILESDVSPEILQESIVTSLGLKLRQYERYPVVLPVERGRIFREFLGYSNSMSEGGMGFETLSRIRGDEMLPLRIYRNSEERPISAVGRVRSVRPNLETGNGYSVGVEFYRMSRRDRDRLLELFPSDSCVVWGPDRPTDVPPDDPPTGGRRG